MIETLNPYVKVVELKFDRKLGRGDETTLYGVPDGTIVVFHNNRVDQVKYGGSLTVKGGSNRAAPMAYKVLAAIPPVTLEGTFESQDPSLRFPITAQLIVRIANPVDYLVNVTKPFESLQLTIGRTITSVTRKHPLRGYDTLPDKIEQALLAMDTTRSCLKVEHATVDVKLDADYVELLRQQRAIEDQKTLASARGKTRDEILADLTSMLDLVQKLRLRMDDLGIQDVLLDGLRVGIETNIQQLLGGSPRTANAQLPAGHSNVDVRVEEPNRTSTRSPRDALGGSSDDFGPPSVTVHPPASNHEQPQVDDDDLFFDDDDEDE